MAAKTNTAALVVKAKSLTRSLPKQDIQMSEHELTVAYFKLAEQFKETLEDYKKLAIDYASMLVECRDEHRKSTERFNKLVISLIRSGAISSDPTQTPGG